MRKNANSVFAWGKFIVFISILALVSIAFVSQSKPALASVPAGSDLDQACNNYNISNGSGYFRIQPHTDIQTFKPSKDTMTQVLLRVSGNGSDASVTTQIIDITDSSSVVASTLTVIHSSLNWYEFNFPNVHLNTAHVYGIKTFATSYNAYWLISTNSNPDCYAGGQAIVDGVPRADTDFGFVVYGYNAPVTPQVANDTSSAVSVTPSASTNTGATGQAPAVTTIASPALIQLLLNNNPQPLNKEVAAGATDRLVAEGTATPGLSVNFSIGDQTFAAVAGTDGKWSSTFDMDSFRDGSYTVKAQAVDSSGKSSQAVDLFRFNRLEVNPLASENKGIGLSGTSVLGAYGGPVLGIFLGFVLLAIIVVLIVKHNIMRTANAATNTPSTPVPAADASALTEEPVSGTPAADVTLAETTSAEKTAKTEKRTKKSK